MERHYVTGHSLKRQPTLDNYGFTSRTYLTTRGREPVDEETIPLNNDRVTTWHLNITGLWQKLDRLTTAIHNTPEKPDVIGL